MIQLVQTCTVMSNSSINVTGQQVWKAWNVSHSEVAQTTINIPVGFTTSAMWVVWNVDYYSGSTASLVCDRPTPIQLSQVELELRRQFNAEERGRALARQRAKTLLEEHLSAEQRDSLAKTKRFIVHSRDRQREYEITQGRAGNVFLLSAGKRIKKLCIHPDMACPDEDTMLAQKLLLEADEQEFLRIANQFDLARPA